MQTVYISSGNWYAHFVVHTSCINQPAGTMTGVQNFTVRRKHPAPYRLLCRLQAYQLEDSQVKMFTIQGLFTHTCNSKNAHNFSINNKCSTV